MNYIFSGISPGMSLEYLNLLEEDKANIMKKATPVLRKVIMSLSSAIDYPMALKKETHAWFIAAYPDVLDFFYPSPDYTEKNLDREIKPVGKNRKVINPIKDDFLNNLDKKYSDSGTTLNIELMLMELKNYYKNDLNKQFLLSKN